MMRAIRFATQLNFTIEEESLQSITKNSDRIKIITKERIVTELNKILESKTPSIGFLLLEKTKLLQYYQLLLKYDKNYLYGVGLQLHQYLLKQ